VPTRPTDMRAPYSRARLAWLVRLAGSSQPKADLGLTVRNAAGSRARACATYGRRPLSVRNVPCDHAALLPEGRGSVASPALSSAWASRWCSAARAGSPSSVQSVVGDQPVGRASPSQPFAIHTATHRPTPSSGSCVAGRAVIEQAKGRPGLHRCHQHEPGLRPAHRQRP
jgi:hypothetical protein